MNLLSLLSFATFIISTIVSYKIAKISMKNSANQIAMSISACVAFFGLAQTFFFVAPTIEEAWFWHKLGAIGWITLVALVLQYTLYINDRYSKYTGLKYRVIINIPAVVMIIYMWTTNISPAAETFIQSSYGLGWCYVNSVNNHFLWIFIIYILFYTGVWIIYIFNFGITAKSEIVSRESRIIAILDFLFLMICIVCDFLLPILITGISPIAIGVLLLFVIRVYISLYKSSIFTIINFVKPQVILDTITDPTMVIDMKGYIVSHNPATKEWLGSFQNDIVGRKISEILKQNNNDIIIDLDETRELQEIVWNGGNEDERVYILSISIVRSEKYGAMAKVLVFRNVTIKKIMENQLRISKENYKKQALTDTLTKLYNRRVFFERFNKCVKEYNDSSYDFALFVIDINNFKYVNDTFGHALGDKLLVEVADRLKSCTESNILLARMGGDEFSFIYENLKDEKELKDFAEKIKNKFKAEIKIEEFSRLVTVSIGYSRFSETENKTEIFITADNRMYEEKRKNKMDFEHRFRFRSLDRE